MAQVQIYDAFLDLNAAPGYARRGSNPAAWGGYVGK
jgi:hypothetical protein